MPFTITRATKLSDDLVEATARLTASLGSFNQVTISPEYVQRLVDTDAHHWLIARDDDTHAILGMASLYILPEPTNVRSMLENVVVAADARGQGIGTALCTRAQEIAIAHHVNTLRAAVAPENTASRGMLEKLGFLTDTDLIHVDLSLHEGKLF